MSAECFQAEARILSTESTARNKLRLLYVLP
jgi:hypothetical protein